MMRSPLWVSLTLLIVCLLTISSFSTDVSTSTSSAQFGIQFVQAAGKQRRTLSDKELEKIEDQWMEDEEEEEGDAPFKWRRGEDGSRQPPEQTGPKTEMGFVTVDSKLSKDEVSKVAGRWTDQLVTGGVETRAYPIDANRVLFVCDRFGARDMIKVREFLMSQKEVIDFEWNQKKVTKEQWLAGAGNNLDDELTYEDKFNKYKDEEARRARALARKKKREARKNNAGKNKPVNVKLDPNVEKKKGNAPRAEL